MCVSHDEFFRMKEGRLAAAGASTYRGAAAPSGSSASSARSDTDTATFTTSATLFVNGNNPATWQEGTPWQDNLGVLFTHDGENETVYSTSTVDTSQPGTTTIDYWAQVPPRVHLPLCARRGLAAPLK